MDDIVLLTPREAPTGAPGLNNENVSITDQEYASLNPALRMFYEKVRENLGVACIASFLRARDVDVSVINLHGRNPTDESVTAALRVRRPAIVGVSAMYDLHLADAQRLVACARAADPDVFIVLGGAFCTYNAQLILEWMPEVDCVAVGEGEQTAADLVDCVVRGGGDWQTVKGLSYRDGGAVRSTGPPSLVDVASAPWPSRDVLAHHRAAGIPTPVASTYASRGCHANCTFCYAPRAPGASGWRWRLRPVGAIVDEIEQLRHDFGTRFVWFNDDNFSGAFGDGTLHALEFAEEVLRRDVRAEFHCEFRVDSGLIDRDALQMLRRAGIRSVLLGLESGAPSVLKRFRKGATVHHNYDAARLVKEEGISFEPGWIFFDPGTTLDELWESLIFLVSAHVHETSNPFLLFNRAIALRGTEMFEQVEQSGRAVANGDEGEFIDLLRRDYRLADARLEVLWEEWSATGAVVNDRRENIAPFVAQGLAQATRALRRRGADSEATRQALRRLSAWQRGLPSLFLAIVNGGLVLADGSPLGDVETLRSRLRALLAELVEGFDSQHLGSGWGAFETATEGLTAASTFG
jgi:radical SAM superfamily enzyme YgiQ (UPF0313 family)